MNKIVKIGFPMEYEDDKNVIRTGLWLKEYEVEMLEKKLNEYNNLQSKIDKANELLQEILVVSDWEHKGKFRPVKNTSAQDVYKTICMLYGILETPYRSDYGALKEDK